LRNTNYTGIPTRFPEHGLAAPEHGLAVADFSTLRVSINLKCILGWWR